MGQGRLACVCPTIVVRSQMGLSDDMGGCIIVHDEKETGQVEMTGILFWLVLRPVQSVSR